MAATTILVVTAVDNIIVFAMAQEPAKPCVLTHLNAQTPNARNQRALTKYAEKPLFQVAEQMKLVTAIQAARKGKIAAAMVQEAVTAVAYVRAKN
jgi:hypothetical protein